MPLLRLFEAGFCASVGVSKPAGASLGACYATPTKPMAMTPTSKTATESHLSFFMYTTFKIELPFLLTPLAGRSETWRKLLTEGEDFKEGKIIPRSKIKSR